MLTETWIRNEEDHVAVRDLAPAGYAMHNIYRDHQEGEEEAWLLSAGILWLHSYVSGCLQFV